MINSYMIDLSWLDDGDICVDKLFLLNLLIIIDNACVDNCCDLLELFVFDIRNNSFMH